MFASPDEASGYISQAVAVSCIPNNARFANNSALISSLTAEIDKYNKSTGEKGMDASTYKIKSNTPTTRWGKSVADLVVTEDNFDVSYTMIVTPQYVYEVKVFGATSDAFVKDTAKKFLTTSPLKSLFGVKIRVLGDSRAKIARAENKRGRRPSAQIMRRLVRSADATFEIRSNLLKNVHNYES